MGIPVHGWPDSSFLFDTLTIQSGRRLASGDRQGILLGARLAKSIKKDAGRRRGDRVLRQIPRRRASFTVSMCWKTPAPSCGSADLQQLMDRPGQVTEFQIKVDRRLRRHAVGPERIRRQIEELKDPAGERWGLSATASQQYASGSTEVHMAHGMAWATTAVAMVDRLRRRAQHDEHVGLRADAGDRRPAGDRLAQMADRAVGCLRVGVDSGRRGGVRRGGDHSARPAVGPHPVGAGLDSPGSGAAGGCTSL